MECSCTCRVQSWKESIHPLPQQGFLGSPLPSVSLCPLIEPLSVSDVRGCTRPDFSSRSSTACASTVNASSTLVPWIAEVSIKGILNSLASARPDSYGTTCVGYGRWRDCSRSKRTEQQHSTQRKLILVDQAYARNTT
jgi:hypothetical protein